MRGRTSTQAIVRLREPALRTFVGRELTLVTEERVELWKADPHGMAWAHVRGTSDPELVLVRGALQGSLAPPLDPKSERFYEYAPSTAGLYSMAAEGFLPRSYARSRQIEWVDVDGDGVLELYVGNRESANQLLCLDGAGQAYEDRAAEHGLDVLAGESFAWMDLDGDAREDVLFMGEGGLSGLRNGDGATFLPIDLDQLGLSLGGGPTADLFRRVRLHVADFDNDGQLDVLVSAIGQSLGLRLFLRRGAGFRDSTATAGLAAVRNAPLVLPVDVDNDSFADLAIAAESLRLLHNERGREFSSGVISAFVPGRPVDAAALTDVDGDGFEDILLVRAGQQSARRLVAHNTSVTRNRFLRVELRTRGIEPVGALVSAHYADGTVRTQRLGSANNPPFCQALGPLLFGVPAETALERVSVRWPGRLDSVDYPEAVRHVGGTVRLEP